MKEGRRKLRKKTSLEFNARINRRITANINQQFNITRATLLPSNELSSDQDRK